MTTTSDHEVRHLLYAGDYVRTEFRCLAASGAPCRTVCERCIVDESREECQCDYVTESGDFDESEAEKVGREPRLAYGRPCNVMGWLTFASEETFGGPDNTELRGPGWQPIDAIWHGEGFEWVYKADAVGQ